MTDSNYPFREVNVSLADMTGEAHTDCVCEARASLSGEDPHKLRRLANDKVDLYPAAWHQHLLTHLPKVGTQVCTGESFRANGATSYAFAAADHPSKAPLAGYGFYRIGTDGRLYLITKSEHYHAPVGHSFPGYALLDNARQLGIPNATHNNTRGHITRLLEQELVRIANGLLPSDHSALIQGCASRQPDELDRVINLETGSLAVEAGVKMMLARFYQVQAGNEEPSYSGRIPVFLVMGDDNGELAANYHGTTFLTQIMRGMWPKLSSGLDGGELLRICPIRPNSVVDIDKAFACYERSPYKIAGFLHEIVMMNYGAHLLSRDFLNYAYALCCKHDVPTLVDEIQSCLWAPGLFLFREYGLRPTFVAMGKGLSGGEYPASKLLFSASMDSLPQFGALVTNGQEEIASLAYLITMRWAEENAEVIRTIGDYYEERMRDMASRYSQHICAITGQRHLLGIEFHCPTTVQAFTETLNHGGFDISSQTYKPECPSVALTKLPVTACTTVVDFVIQRMQDALDAISVNPHTKDTPMQRDET